jgi:hypothetical protein
MSATITDWLWATRNVVHPGNFECVIIDLAIDFVVSDPLGLAAMYRAQARSRWRYAQTIRAAARRERCVPLRDNALGFAEDIERGAIVYEACALALDLVRYGVKP